MERGDVDIAMFVIQTPEREGYAWLVPYMVQKNYVLVAREFKGKFKSMAAFEADPAATFGVVRGFVHGPAYEAFLTRMRNAKRVVEVNGSEQLFRMVTANRVHAVMSLPTVAAP